MMRLKHSIVTFRNSIKYMSTSIESEVLFEVINNVGVITLNKPKSLNSLNEPMAKQISTKLQEWESTISFIIIQGSIDKAFCAGGDVVAVTRGTSANSHIGKCFFRTEYKMNYLIGMYQRPYIAMINGITMGGGVGLSVHAPYRIATEKTLFAMPETAIGLFPDVGATHVLPKLKGKLGLYLGLTGIRLRGIDVVKAGIATHFLNSEQIPDFRNRLLKINPEDIGCFLQKNTIDLSVEQFSLNPYLDQIDDCFSGDTIEHIIQLLKKDGSQWASETLQLLHKMSPISLKISKKALDLGSVQNLRQCLKMEYRLAVAAVEAKVSTDFYEGVRALLIDKDKNAKWNPSSIEEVTDEMVDKCFSQLPDAEELDI